MTTSANSLVGVRVSETLNTEADGLLCALYRTGSDTVHI